jgi:hypothetical protein
MRRSVARCATRGYAESRAVLTGWFATGLLPTANLLLREGALR